MTEFIQTCPVCSKTHFPQCKLIGLGIINRCPNCGSFNLKDESGILTEGCSCLDCDWSDIDGGVDSGS